MDKKVKNEIHCSSKCFLVKMKKKIKHKSTIIIYECLKLKFCYLTFLVFYKTDIFDVLKIFRFEFLANPKYTFCVAR